MQRHTTRQLFSFFLLSIFIAVPQLTFANAFEDTFGTDARIQSMGGAGTSLAENYAATYYNPANLSQCDTSQLSFTYEHIQYQPSLRSKPDLPEAENLRPLNLFIIGACADLPWGFNLGFLYSQGVRHPQYLNQSSVDAKPRFVYYGQRMENMSIMAALSYSFLNRYAIGIGTSMLATSNLRVGNEVPIMSSDHEARNAYTWEMGRAASFMTGLSVKLHDNFSLGLTFRSALYHEMHITAPTLVEFVGIPVELKLNLRSVSWYSPHQLALGFHYVWQQHWIFTSDITWYDWSQYPGPFISATSDPDSPTSSLVTLPPNESAHFHDIVVPRIGIEYTSESNWSLRSGYNYRPTPVPKPSGRANLLDSNTHVFTLGMGYLLYFKEKIPSLATEAKQKNIGSYLSIDLFVALGFMSKRTVNKLQMNTQQNYSFSCRYFNTGLTLNFSF